MADDLEELGAGRIVVGVDGSDGATAALTWATDEAGYRHRPLLIISAWRPGIAPGPGPGMVLAHVRPAAQRVVQAAVETARARGAAAEGLTLAGDPANLLCLAARSAELLVVGSRGHGAVLSAVMGSVSTSCVHHAVCPVVVVRRAAARQVAPGRFAAPAAAL